MEFEEIVEDVKKHFLKSKIMLTQIGTGVMAFIPILLETLMDNIDAIKAFDETYYKVLILTNAVLTAYFRFKQGDIKIKKD